jgi:hypothetical protein
MLAYRLKYVQTAIATKTIAAIQRDKSLILVFLAMNPILSPTSYARGGHLLRFVLPEPKTLEDRTAPV